MLEKADKKWTYWAINTPKAALFRHSDTRSFEIWKDFFIEANCRTIITDAYSSYACHINDINLKRLEKKKKPIVHQLCNAHAFRNFKVPSVAAGTQGREVMHYYGKLFEYYAEHREVREYLKLKELKDSKGEQLTPSDGQSKIPKRTLDEILKLMHDCVEKITEICTKMLEEHSSATMAYDAAKYFLDYKDKLTYFLKDPSLPIDNNLSERNLRRKVILRKICLGTHSEKQALAQEKLETIFGTCKSIGVDPRAFLLESVSRHHLKQSPITPQDYKNLLENGHIKKPAYLTRLDFDTEPQRVSNSS
jgi:hypothetical protein